MTKGDDSTYPTALPADTMYATNIQSGLTKREYFAIQILKGMYASQSLAADNVSCYVAVKKADKLIEELNKNNEAV